MSPDETAREILAGLRALVAAIPDTPEFARSRALGLRAIAAAEADGIGEPAAAEGEGEPGCRS